MIILRLLLPGFLKVHTGKNINTFPASGPIIFLTAPKVESMEEINQKLMEWCNSQRQLRIKEWEQEKKELLPLSAQPFKCSTTKMVTSSISVKLF